MLPASVTRRRKFDSTMTSRSSTKPALGSLHKAFMPNQKSSTIHDKSFPPGGNFSQLLCFRILPTTVSLASSVDKLRISLVWHCADDATQSERTHARPLVYIECSGVIRRANSIHHQGPNFIPMPLDTMLHTFWFNLLRWIASHFSACYSLFFLPCAPFSVSW